MIRMLLAIGAALSLGTAAVAQAPAAPAPAQPATPASPSAQFWAVSDSQIASIPARIAFPLRAGLVSARRHQEFSHEGEGIDNAIQYNSDDRAIYATVYVYYPGLPHAGLAAFATDHVLRTHPELGGQGGEMRVVDAGGRTGVAIRADYSQYRGDNSSSAAWIKTGRWLIKFRVSGPTSRRADVFAAMDALLRDVQFGAVNRPYPAAPVAVTDCPAGTGATPARMLPDVPAAEVAAHGFLATFDGGGIEGRDESDGGRPTILPSRVPERMCRTLITVNDGQVPVLHGEPGERRSVDGRTMLVVTLGDSGTMFELIKADNLGGYVLLHHEVGRTTVLVRFDGVPSDAQIAEMLTTAEHPATRILVPVDLRPNRGPRMYLPGTPNPPAPET